MKTPKDIYNMDRSSQSGKPGLETFQAEDNGRHFFHFNDAKGKALFYSQGYSTARSRDRAFQTVLKNYKIPGRIEKQSVAKGVYFILKNGNQKEFARSRNFRTEKEMDQSLAYLKKQLAALDTDIKVKAPKKTTKVSKKKEVESNLLKYSFRVDFYQSEKSSSLRGKIEYSLTREKTHFEGLDGEAIIDFINNYLPEPAPPEEQTFVDPSAGEAREIQILVDQANINNFSLDHNEEFAIELAVDKGEKTFNFDASVVAKEMTSGNLIVLSKKTGSITGEDNVSFSISPNSLKNGYYRLLTSVDLAGKSGKGIKLEGSKLVHVY